MPEIIIRHNNAFIRKRQYTVRNSVSHLPFGDCDMSPECFVMNSDEQHIRPVRLTILRKLLSFHFELA